MSKTSSPSLKWGSKLPVAALRPHPMLARSVMEEEALEYLRENGSAGDVEARQDMGSAFVQSVRDNGIMEPIRVCRTPGTGGGDVQWWVVDGRHRLAAAVACGHTEIECAEVAPGEAGGIILAAGALRKTLTAGARAWLALCCHPEVTEARRGGDRSKPHQCGLLTAEDLARRAGVGLRTMEQAVKLWSLTGGVRRNKSAAKTDAAIAAGMGLGALIAGLEGAAALEDEAGTRRKPESNLKGYMRSLGTLKTVLGKVHKWSAEQREAGVTATAAFLAANKGVMEFYLEAIAAAGETE